MAELGTHAGCGVDGAQWGTIARMDYAWRETVPAAAWIRLGRRDRAGLMTDRADGSHWDSQRGKRRLFSPSKDDFAHFIAEASDDEIDAFARTVTNDPSLLADGIRHLPHIIAALGELRCQSMSEGLQIVAGNALTNSKSSAIADLSFWRKANSGTLPEALQLAGLVADGLEYGMQEATQADLARRAQPTPTEPVTMMIGALAGWLLTNSFEHEPLRRAHRRRLRAAISDQPEQWLALLPWVSQMVGSLSTLLDAVTWAMDAKSDPVPTLHSIASGTIRPAADRAAGVLATFEGTNQTAALLNALAREYDRGLGDGFPHPLSAPTSTWLSSHDLERRLREAVKIGRARWSLDFVAHGKSEEEGHTAALMTQIQHALEAADAFNASEAQHRPVELAGEYRKISKTEEAMVRADLALVIRIDIHGELRTRYAELVQVKKTLSLKTLDALGAPESDKWKIEIPQLRGLLGKSPTATYWLITHDGHVLVLPGKILLGIVNSKANVDQGTLIVNYSQLRHATIDLDAYLVDLTIGGWVGSTNEELVALASGNPGATTIAADLFELSVRRQAE